MVLNIRILIVFECLLLFPLTIFGVFGIEYSMQLALVRFNTHTDSINSEMESNSLCNYCIFLINKVGIILNISCSQIEMNMLTKSHVQYVCYSCYVLTIEMCSCSCSSIRFHQTFSVFTVVASLNAKRIRLKWNEMK